MRPRIAIVGCGAVARRAHIPALLEAGFEIKVCCDLSEAAARKAAKQAKAKWATSLHEALSEKVDVVDVCTPPSSHHKIALEALSAGIPVVIEKPIALSYSEAREMAEEADRRGLGLAVVHNHRYAPPLARLKKLIEEGKLGRLLHLSAELAQELPFRWSKSTWQFTSAEGGGVLFNVGVHLADILLWLGGPAEPIAAIGGDLTREMGAENHVVAMLEFESGASGLLAVSWIAGGFRHRIEAIGTAATAAVDPRRGTMLLYSGHLLPTEELASLLKGYLGMAKGAITGALFRGYLEYHKPLLKDTVEALISGRKPPVTAWEAAEAVRLLEEIRAKLVKYYGKHYKGGEP